MSGMIRPENEGAEPKAMPLETLEGLLLPENRQRKRRTIGIAVIAIGVLSGLLFGVAGLILFSSSM